MTELSDDPELQAHSQSVLYIISAITAPPEVIDSVISAFVDTIKSSSVSLSQPLNMFEFSKSCLVLAYSAIRHTPSDRFLLSQFVEHFR